MAKPVIKVYLLPAKWVEADFRQLFRDLVKAAKKVPHWGIKREGDIIILFPPDRMQKGLGSDVHIEIDLPQPSDLGRGAEREIAAKIGRVVFAHLEIDAYVQCKVYKFNTNTEEGYWTSDTEGETAAST